MSRLAVLRISSGSSRRPYFDTIRHAAFTCAASMVVESHTHRTGTPSLVAA